MSIGVLQGYTLSSSSPDIKQSVVWYGTAAVQGGLASRPGQSFINILRRQLKDTEIYNFGFSAHALPMDTNVVKFLTQIPSQLFVIDCLSDMDASSVEEQAEPVIKLVRSSHPETPILLAEGPPIGNAWIMPELRKLQEDCRAALRSIYNHLVNAGDKNLYYAQGDKMFNTSEGSISPTVQGKLPTDLGMYDLADNYRVIIPQIMKKNISLSLETYGFNHVSTTQDKRSGESETKDNTLNSLVTDSIIFKDFQELGVRGRAYNDTANYFN